MVFLRIVNVKFWKVKIVLARVRGRRSPSIILVANENVALRVILKILAIEVEGPTKVSRNFLASLSSIMVRYTLLYMNAERKWHSLFDCCSQSLTLLLPPPTHQFTKPTIFYCCKQSLTWYWLPPIHPVPRFLWGWYQIFTSQIIFDRADPRKFSTFNFLIQMLYIFNFKLYLTAKFTYFFNHQNFTFCFKIDPQ